MKRILSLALCAIVAVTCFTGCASSQQMPETEKASTAAADTKVVETVMGPVEIPNNPKRIASALIGITGYLTALDMIPVGTATQSGFPDYIKSNLAGSVDLGETDSLNLEALMELEPDLIIGIASVHKEQYELLSAIAPTVLLESATDDWATFHTVAQLVGKQETASELQKEYDERSTKLQQEIKEKYPQGAKVAYMRVQGKELQMLNPDSVYFKDLYHDMSWTSASEGVVDFGDGWNATISMEALPQLDMDYLILAVPMKPASRHIRN